MTDSESVYRGMEWQINCPICNLAASFIHFDVANSQHARETIWWFLSQAKYSIENCIQKKTMCEWKCCKHKQWNCVCVDTWSMDFVSFFSVHVASVLGIHRKIVNDKHTIVSSIYTMHSISLLSCPSYYWWRKICAFQWRSSISNDRSSRSNPN